MLLGQRVISRLVRSRHKRMVVIVNGHFVPGCSLPRLPSLYDRMYPLPTSRRRHRGAVEPASRRFVAQSRQINPDCMTLRGRASSFNVDTTVSIGVGVNVRGVIC